MTKYLSAKLVFPALLAAAPLVATAQSNFFNDTFTGASTVNATNLAKPTPNSASYVTLSQKAWAPVPTVSSHDLRFGIASSTGGIMELQALFTTNPVVMSSVGDNVQLTITFTNTSGLLLTGAGFLDFGLYNSSQVAPFPGGLNGNLTSSSNYIGAGYAQGWVGYVGEISYSGGKTQIRTRPSQTGSDNRNDDVTSAGSSATSYANPAGATVGSSLTSSTVLVSNATYTEVLSFTLASSTSLNISNVLYSGAGTNGTVVSSIGGVATNTTFLTSGFDSLAMGFYQKTGGPSNVVDISSITVSGAVTAVPTPPTITSEPASVSVVSGQACAMSVAATGFNLSYQWHRNNSNLVNGGNISGATSPQLVISPATSGDVFNNYYATVTGTGNLTTNSSTVSLALIPSTSLVYSGSGPWDLNTSQSWVDAATLSVPEYFNFGDPVTFNDFGGGGIVTLTGSFLSAASVTVSHSSSFYTFQGTGSFAGPGNLSYIGSGQLTINCANTYTGGTLISNASAYLILSNLSGLGTGPVTLAKAGGQMEIVGAASATAGINSSVNVQDDFTFIVDPVNSTYGMVLNGDLSGTAGKTLTINHGGAGSGTSNTRLRLAGTNTVYNGNLVLNDSTLQMASYQTAGSQTYNGVISGTGSFIQKNATTYMNGPNTYSGGTIPAAGSIGLGTSCSGTANNVTAGPIGTGTLNLVNDSTTSLTGTGEIFASGGARTLLNSIQWVTGSNNLMLVLGGTNNLTLAGTFSLQGQDGSGAGTNRTIEVTNTALSTISGQIVDGGAGLGLVKTGSNTLALSAANTYSGPTLVGGGTLQVDGSIASGAVTVTNGTLAGVGTIGGAVTIQTTNGALAPGDNGIGTLTINNTLSLQAGSTTYIEVNKQAGTHDLVQVSGSVAYGGTLNASNLAGTPNIGDTFTVFSAGGHSGNFTNITGSAGAGKGWAFNPTNGVLTVIQSVATNPTNITYGITSAGGLALHWPADHLGWTLEAQTNPVSVGITTNWSRVAGSASVTGVTNSISTNNGAVFYRLVYP